jgi:hypothetical protein
LADIHDFLESDASIVLVLGEHIFEERNHAYFLLQVLELLNDVGESASIFLVLGDGVFKFFNLTMAKGLEEVVKPLKVSAD